MIAVCNSTPLIHMARSNQLGLLPLLFEQVHIPPQVFDETVTKGRRHADSSRIEEAVLQGWLKVTPFSTGVELLFLDLSATFGSGEAGAIVLAHELKPERLILDERGASKKAELLGLGGILVGTIGILARARKKGLLPAIKPSLDALRSTNFWIDDELYRRVLEDAGEA